MSGEGARLVVYHERELRLERENGSLLHGTWVFLVWEIETRLVFHSRSS